MEWLDKNEFNQITILTTIAFLIKSSAISYRATELSLRDTTSDSLPIAAHLANTLFLAGNLAIISILIILISSILRKQNNLKKYKNILLRISDIGKLVFAISIIIALTATFS